MHNSFLKKLKLSNFRNFSKFEADFSSNQILITGRNGSGKTSILESISLLFPGRGLRGSKFCEIISQDSQESNCYYETNSYIGDYNIAIELNKNNSKRSIKLNDSAISAKELNNLLMTFWIIPQQNILFNESQNVRRKFFDRLTFIFNPNHASQINKYEYYQRERIKIITEYAYDKSWVDIIEQKLAILAKEISDDRHNLLNKLNDTIEKIDTTFPKLSCALVSEIDNIYYHSNNFIDDIKLIFKKNRNEDSNSHKTSFGVLKTDFRANFLSKNKDLSICSTGEQHAGLIAIKIAITEKFMNEKNKKPILLLDELFVHLDERNKEYLSHYLNKNNIQTFVTTTEKELCKDFAKNAQIISL